ncbi:hypothetical protein KAW80_02670 [Candidatus Babeliales bacterium]|nr:hypothetical protein [Candidatus Babeliales bacterium]
MKKSLQRVLTVVAVLSSVTSYLMAGDVTSQTFFMPRSYAENSEKELALHNYCLYHDMREDRDYVQPEDRSIIKMQNTYFYEGSTNEQDLARYFLLGNKTSLQVAELGVSLTATTDRDINPRWFGVQSSSSQYKSTIAIRPDREAYGAIINTHHDMSKWVKGLWLGVLLPIVHVRHALDITETRTATFDTIHDAETSMINALNNSDWLFGKFKPTSMSHTGLDDAQIKLGWNFWRKNEAKHWGLYLDALIPTGVRPSSEYVFEPTVGNVHWGLGAGTNLDWELTTWKKAKVSVQLDAKYRYLFSDTERRSFDLTNGPWTRYLTLRKLNEVGTALVAGVVPGINYFTQDVKITPRSRVDLFTALHYKKSSLNVEAGYNLWWKDSEKISLDKTFDQSVGINFGGTASTYSDATVGQVVPTADSSVTAVDPDTKFNLDSATHKSALTHKIFAGVGLTGKVFDAKGMIGLGGSYEFADRNTALEQWSVYGKTSLSF